MKREEYTGIEGYMLECMSDSAHDAEHIYRVLYGAMDIAAAERDVNYDVLIAACLLHDIGRERQFADPGLCHAREGGGMAYDYLTGRGWPEAAAAHVRDCITTHRYRGDNPPASLEAKILFDADKLDVTGTMGIARTLSYKGQHSEPLYLMDDNDQIITGGGGGDITSFFQEYNFKLRKIYDGFYTPRAKAIAEERKAAADHFYHSLFEEVTKYRSQAKSLLAQRLTGL